MILGVTGHRPPKIGGWKTPNPTTDFIIVCKGGYAAWKMQVRNEYIVNNSDSMIAVHDGSKGGTYNCIKYAESLGREIFRIDPRNISLQR